MEQALADQPISKDRSCTRQQRSLCRLRYQMPERGHHFLIDLALERHDKVGQILHGPPCPSVELGLVAARRRIDLDLALLAVKAEGKPFLRLAAISSLE